VTPAQWANLPDFGLHDLRHTLAPRFAIAGVDLYTVLRAAFALAVWSRPEWMKEPVAATLSAFPLS